MLKEMILKIRALTLERSQIMEAMGFALDNADAAGEVILGRYLYIFVCKYVRTCSHQFQK